MIRGYGKESITVRDKRFSGSVIVFPQEAKAWSATSLEQLAIDDFSCIIDYKDKVDLLLFGSGETHQFLPSDIEFELKKHGIVVESMTTGAACRTYNTLMSEDRLVAAALLGI